MKIEMKKNLVCVVTMILTMQSITTTNLPLLPLPSTTTISLSPPPPATFLSPNPPFSPPLQSIHFQVISPAKPTQAELENFEYNLIVVAACLSSIINVYLLRLYGFRQMVMRSVSSFFGLILALSLGWAPSLLLGPQNLIVASIMTGVGFVGTCVSFVKLGLEMKKSGAFIYYSQRGDDNKKIVFIEMKHILEVLLPFSYLKYAITLVCEIALMGHFDYRIKLIFKAWFALVAGTMGMVNYVRERRNVMREDENGGLIEMTVSPRTPCKCNCIVMRDKVKSESDVVGVEDNVTQELLEQTAATEDPTLLEQNILEDQYENANQIGSEVSSETNKILVQPKEEEKSAGSILEICGSEKGVETCKS